LKQTKEGVPKQALHAGSAVSTLVASAMAPGVDRPTFNGGIEEKRRGKRVSAGLLQRGKWVLEWLNDVQKGQG